MKVLQYAVCINSFAAWKAIAEEETGVDLMTPRMFGERTEAEAWMRSQKHPKHDSIVDRLVLLLPPDFLMQSSAGSYNAATLSELGPEYTANVETVGSRD